MTCDEKRAGQCRSLLPAAKPVVKLVWPLTLPSGHPEALGVSELTTLPTLTPGDDDTPEMAVSSN